MTVVTAALLAACVGCGALSGSQPGAGSAVSNRVGSDPASPGQELTFHIVPQQSNASYQAQEKWLRWPLPTKAAAKTGDVEGELVLVTGEQPRLTSSHFQVDVSTLVSQTAETPLFERPAGLFLAQRDSAVRRLLAADQYRFAEFTAAGLEALPTRYVEGQPANVRVSGNLTVHGMTRPATFATEATLQGSNLSGTASTQILMTDFGVDPPRAAGGHAMDVEDQLTIVVNFVATASPIPNSAASLADRNPKLDAALAAVGQTVNSSGPAAGLEKAREMGLDVEGNKVRLIVAVNPGGGRAARAQDDVRGAGGEVVGDSPTSILALVPVSVIEQLAGSADVAYLRMPLKDESG
ncbi:MAG TPA: YceI family protein [Chloroflexota bacterium]